MKYINSKSYKFNKYINSLIKALHFFILKLSVGALN